jgi:hypothetical protein
MVAFVPTSAKFFSFADVTMWAFRMVSGREARRRMRHK